MKGTILYFFDYGFSFGGAVNTLMQQMLLVQKAGYEVHGFVSDYMGIPSNPVSEEIFKVHGIILEHLNYTICSHTEEIDIIGVLEKYEEVKRVILKYNPILLHSVQINPTVELVSRELRIPHIMNIYQSDPDFFSIPYTNIFAQYHICDSKCYAKEWSKGLDIESTCIRTVVNEYHTKKTIRVASSIRFICVGQVTARKNQLEVIKGFESALKKGVKGILYLYGKNIEKYGEECMNYVRKNDLRDKIKFCGFVSPMSKVYAESDVLICGSTIESYPNVISEALANGVIVISSPVAGVPEVIKDGENGFLSNGYTAEDFAEKVEECYQVILNNSIQTILKNANNTFQEVHSEKKVTADLIDFYQEILNRKDEYDLPRIDDVKVLFSDIIDKYIKGKSSFQYEKIVRKKLWYLYHMQKILEKRFEENKETKIFIWGTGSVSKYAIEMWNCFFNEIKITAFIDSFKEGHHLQYQIKKPEEIIYDKNNIILIALSNGINDVREKLTEASREYGWDYFLLVSRLW